MSKIIAYLNNNTLQNLKELSKNTDKSLSKTASELIEIGYQIKQYQEKQKLSPEEERKVELKNKHTEYLLRIMATAADIYRCVRNENSKYDVNDANTALDIIATNTESFIDGILGRDR